MSIKEFTFKKGDAVCIQTASSMYICKLDKIIKNKIYTRKFLRQRLYNKNITDFHDANIEKKYFQHGTVGIYYLIDMEQITKINFMSQNQQKMYMREMKKYI